MNQRPVPRQTQLAQILLNRLEKISPDSPWAHQASGVRASIAKILSRSTPDQQSLDKLMELGFEVLEKAAVEIPED
jgi:hypothetical protein